MERFNITLHGSRLAYRRVGEGPAVLLIHGLAQESSTWEVLAEQLADHADLIAPDLPGHGDSASPGGDHSLGSYATVLRDLLLALDLDSATIVGHSLGGGVALQFAYQFPEMVGRLVLMDSGGLGNDLSPILRAATLPGADGVLGVASDGRINKALRRGAHLLQNIGLGPRSDTDVDLTIESIQRLGDKEARQSFIRTVHSVIELSGQSVSALGKLYLMAQLPTLIVWGEDDTIIPLHHGTTAHEAMEGSRLAIIEGAGHFPHIDNVDEVASTLVDFLGDTEPARVRSKDIARLLRSGNGEVLPHKARRHTAGEGADDSRTA